ncbi:hypothetical protein FTV88_0601 [Heliorestis convoluta]|uniref:Uncharacterized protein n=1 Tax=Heliorestis convoluta TaxID=356322 RepID=A0A5Q2N380_9FIRM|nr:hypothetical protein FTV88_0601 [Heliorestis convoluta]
MMIDLQSLATARTKDGYTKGNFPFVLPSFCFFKAFIGKERKRI